MNNTKKDNAKYNKIKIIFDKSVKQYSTNLELIINDLSNINKIPLTQALHLKYRHDIIIDINKLRHQQNKLESQFFLKNKERMDFYKTKTNIAYNSFSELDMAIKSDLNEMHNIKNLFETQMSFLLDARDTIDKIGFAIKNRIDLFNNSTI